MQRLVCLTRQYRAEILFLVGYSFLFYMFVHFFVFLLPIALGAFLATVSLPVYRFIKRKFRWKVSVCVHVVTSILAVVCIFVICLLSLLITYEILNFREQIRYFQFAELHPDVRSFISGAIAKFSGLFEKDILPSIAPTVVQAIPQVLSHFLSVPAGILLPILSIMLCSLFLSQLKSLKFLAIRILGHRVYKKIRNALRGRASHPHGVILSYFTIYLITFSETLIILSLLKMKYPIITALAVTISDIFPIFGPGIILLPLCIYRLLCGNFIQLFGLLAGWLLITIIRQIIEPRLISKIIKIPASIMFLAIYISLISGSFWYIPYTALLFSLYPIFKESISQHKKSAE